MIRKYSKRSVWAEGCYLYTAKTLCYSPCMVEVPDRPPRRLRYPLELVRAQVYSHSKAVYRLNRQTLRHHHHCRRPDEEDGQRHNLRCGSQSVLFAHENPLSLVPVRTLAGLTFSRFYSPMTAWKKSHCDNIYDYIDNGYWPRLTFHRHLWLNPIFGPIPICGTGADK